MLGNPLANFAGTNANHGIGIGVVIGRSAEDFDADSALLQIVDLTIQVFLNHMPQQGGVAPAVAKMGAREDGA